MEDMTLPPGNHGTHKCWPPCRVKPLKCDSFTVRCTMKPVASSLGKRQKPDVVFWVGPGFGVAHQVNSILLSLQASWHEVSIPHVITVVNTGRKELDGAQKVSFSRMKQFCTLE